MRDKHCPLKGSYETCYKHSFGLAKYHSICMCIRINVSSLFNLINYTFICIQKLYNYQLLCVTAIHRNQNKTEENLPEDI